MNNFKDEREQKFISVYSSYVDEVYQYVYLRSGLNQTAAEDMTQEIFLDVYKGFSGFKGLCSERTWIFKLTRNKLNDFYRKQYSVRLKFVGMDDCDAENIIDLSEDVQDLIIRSFEKEKVKACLSELPEQYKIVLVLKYMDKQSVKNIASAVGKSPKAIESILQRAKKAFIKSYVKYEERNDL